VSEVKEPYIDEAHLYNKYEASKMANERNMKEKFEALDKIKKLEVKLASKDSDIEFLNSVIKEREFLNSVHLKTLKELEAEISEKDAEISRLTKHIGENCGLYKCPCCGEEVSKSPGHFKSYSAVEIELTKAKQDLADAVGLLISYRNMAGVERRSELEKFLSKLKGSE
jgi:uncharacterized coiled-coil protein SlyX